MMLKAKSTIMNNDSRCCKTSFIRVISECGICLIPNFLLCLYFSTAIKCNLNPKSDESNCTIERLEFLLREALDEDEDDDVEDALILYMEAVETGLKIVSF